MFIAFPTNKFRRSVGVQCRLQVALPQKSGARLGHGQYRNAGMSVRRGDAIFLGFDGPRRTDATALRY
jgi:hypothetical protein